MPTCTEILATIEQNRDTLKKFGVRKLGLFGSSTRDDNTDTSDLDFVVEFEKKTFDAYMDTKDFLERIFNRSVDLVITDAIKPRLREAILEETKYAPGL